MISNAFKQFPDFNASHLKLFRRYSSCQKYVPIVYKYISGIRTNHFDTFANVLGEVKRKN